MCALAVKSRRGIVSFGRHYLSNATCLIQALFVVCVCALRRVKDHHNMLHFSPRLKNTSVRQVVLDKWLPLNRVVPYRVMPHLFVPESQRAIRSRQASEQSGQKRAKRATGHATANPRSRSPCN